MVVKKSNSPYKTFGEGLRYHRDKESLTIRDLAARAGKSPTYIHYLEKNFNPASKSGKAKPSVEVVDRIARALGWSQSEARTLAGYAPKDVQPESEFVNFAINNYGDAKALSEDELKDIEEIVKGLISSHAKRKKK